MDGGNAEEHIECIEGWRDVVLERMEGELEAAKACGIEWSIPKIHVKMLTRSGEKYCLNEYSW
jgi:hypothetical protein